MANYGQAIADTKEYTKLISASLIEEVEKLEQIDQQTNKLGQTMVNVGDLTRQIASEVNQSGTNVIKVLDQQEQLAAQTASISEILQTVADDSTSTSDQLQDVSKYVMSVDENILAQTNELLAVINSTNDKYSQSVSDLNDTMISVKDEIQAVDYSDEFKNVTAQLAETQEALEAVKAHATEQQETLVQQLISVIDELDKTSLEMKAIKEQGDDIHSDLKTAIARAGSIEMTLESLTRDETSVATFAPKFDDALEALKREAEGVEISDEETKTEDIQEVSDVEVEENTEA